MLYQFNELGVDKHVNAVILFIILVVVFLNGAKNKDHPDIACLERYAHECCSPFGAAEQWSWWRNETPNVSERQRVFGVPPAASKGNLMDN